MMMILEAVYSFSVPPFHSGTFLFFPRRFLFLAFSSHQRKEQTHNEIERNDELRQKKRPKSQVKVPLCVLFSQEFMTEKVTKEINFERSQCYQRIIKKSISHQKNQRKIRWNFDHFVAKKRNILLLSITQAFHSICTQERNGQ